MLERGLQPAHLFVRLRGGARDGLGDQADSLATELFVETPQGKDAVSAEPVVTVAAPTDVTAREAVLAGAVNPEGRVTTYQFEWGETADYDKRVPAEPETVGSSLAEKPVQQAISGLQPGKQYHYRLVAVSEAGTSRSPDQRFETRQT